MNSENFNNVKKRNEKHTFTSAENTDNAFEYLRPLLSYAAQHIPKEKHKVGVVFVHSSNPLESNRI